VSRRSFVCIVISLLSIGSPVRGEPPAGKTEAAGAKPAASHSSRAAAGKTAVEAAAEIDRRLAAELFTNLPAGQTLAPAAGDEIFLRRLYLDLVGRQPKPEEIRPYVADTAPNKRSQRVAALLDDPRFGVHLANYRRDVILARQNAVGEGPTVFAEVLEKFLTQEFIGNVPWDQIVRKFIEANGPINDRGETAVYIAQGVDTADVAGEMSRLFLGIQIQCAQCHDHPTDRWKRQQFHEFAAFFPRAGVKRIESMPAGRGAAAIAPYDDGPMERTQRTRYVGLREHVMTDLKKPDEPGRIVTPAFFLNGKRLDVEATDAQRRESVARWMTSP